MKRPGGTDRGRKDHGFCCYCKRQLVSSTSRQGTAFTFDHVIAGGGRFVPCCRTCNFLKSDLPFSDWGWFIDHYPRWWKGFTHPAQVVMAIVAERSRRAAAGEAPISRRLLGSRVTNRLPF